MKEIQYNDISIQIQYNGKNEGGTLTQAVAANGFPFEIKRSNNIYQSMSEEDVLKRLEDARKHAEQGTCIDADAFVADMRTKYGI